MIVGHLMPEHDPVHKVTIVPRGQALGVAFFLPEGDEVSRSRLKLEGMIATAYAGRIAEELIYGREKVTTGASSDIQFATNLARNMVTQWGFSDRLGPMQYSKEEGPAFLGRSSGNGSGISDETARIVDEEIKIILDHCYQLAYKTLTDNIDILHATKDALLKYETIDMPQIDDLMNRRPVREPAGWDEDKKVSNVTGSFGTGASASKPEINTEKPQQSEEPKDSEGGSHSPDNTNDNKPQ